MGQQKPRMPRKCSASSQRVSCAEEVSKAIHPNRFDRVISNSESDRSGIMMRWLFAGANVGNRRFGSQWWDPTRDRSATIMTPIVTCRSCPDRNVQGPDFATWVLSAMRHHAVDDGGDADPVFAICLRPLKWILGMKSRRLIRANGSVFSRMICWNQPTRATVFKPSRLFSAGQERD